MFVKSVFQSCTCLSDVLAILVSVSKTAFALQCVKNVSRVSVGDATRDVTA